jgi:hypothetical protein
MLTLLMIFMVILKKISIFYQLSKNSNVNRIHYLNLVFTYNYSCIYVDLKPDDAQIKNMLQFYLLLKNSKTIAFQNSCMGFYLATEVLSIC